MNPSRKEVLFALAIARRAARDLGAFPHFFGLVLTRRLLENFRGLGTLPRPFIRAIQRAMRTASEPSVVAVLLQANSDQFESSSGRHALQGFHSRSCEEGISDARL